MTAAFSGFPPLLEGLYFHVLTDAVLRQPVLVSLYPRMHHCRYYILRLINGTMF